MSPDRGNNDWIPHILAVLIVSIWAVVQCVLLITVIDASMRDLVARMQGILDSALMLVLGYYFGSSAGSRAKDALLRPPQ